MPATPFAACDSTTVTLPDGRVLLNFGGCNYLGLAGHGVVLRAVAEGLMRYGLSATASRETTGNAEPHDGLERDLAGFLGMERALLVPDGYLANVAACQGLASGGCVRALIDAKAHASLADAAMTAGLEIERFAHGNPSALADALRAGSGGPTLVLTDGVFTAGGEVAPLAGYLQASGPDDRLLVDDCHGLGVLGPGGRGTVACWGLRDPRVIVTSSLAKGIGVAGGVVAGTAGDLALCARATAYVCTTPIAPAMACGTRASLSVLLAEPTRVDRLAANAERLRAGLCALGLVIHPEAPHTPIAAFGLGDVSAMRELESRLLARGIRAPLIRYPGGPAEAYFRLTVTADHTPAQIDTLLAALNESREVVVPQTRVEQTRQTA